MRRILWYKYVHAQAYCCALHDDVFPLYTIEATCTSISTCTVYYAIDYWLWDECRIAWWWKGVTWANKSVTLYLRCTQPCISWSPLIWRNYYVHVHVHTYMYTCAYTDYHICLNISTGVHFLSGSGDLASKWDQPLFETCVYKNICQHQQPRVQENGSTSLVTSSFLGPFSYLHSTEMLKKAG